MGNFEQLTNCQPKAGFRRVGGWLCALALGSALVLAGCGGSGGGSGGGGGQKALTQLYIDGEGIFMVSSDAKSYYSTGGVFNTDRDGFLVSPKRYHLQAFLADTNGVMSGIIGSIRVAGGPFIPTTTYEIDIIANLDAGSGIIPTGFNVADPVGTSNHVYPINVGDLNKDRRPVTVYFTKVATNTWGWNVVVDGSESGSGATEVQAQGSLAFDGSGALVVESAINYPIHPLGGFQFNGDKTGSFFISFDYGTGTGQGGTGLDGITQHNAPSANIEYRWNNTPVGVITDFAISPDGVVTIQYDNGETRFVGQLAIVSFNNPNGLTPVGQNLYAESFDSGQPHIGVANSGGRGRVVQNTTFDRRDLVIDGEGYFELTQAGGTDIYYARNGTFANDRDGFLSDAALNRLHGYLADADGIITGTVGHIQVVGGALMAPKATTLVTINSNLDSRNLLLVAPGTFSLSDKSGTSHHSNALTMVDSLGRSHLATVYFTKIAESPSGNTWTWNTVVGASDTASGVEEIQASGTLTFNAAGALDTESPVTYPVVSGGSRGFQFSGGAAANQWIAFNFGTSITTDGGSGLDGTTQYRELFTPGSPSQNGFTSGELTFFTITQDGTVVGSFSNGQSQNLAQLVAALFDSPAGLADVGGGLYQATAASGPANLGTPESNGRGSVLWTPSG